MKKGRNIFFHGYACPPTPQARLIGATLVNSPSSPGGNESLIKKIFLPFFMCLLLQSISHIGFADTITPQVCHLDNCVMVEVVSKDADLERGLMFRTSMDQNKGMLFKFATDDKQSFWMKNMHFNLDILWISVDGEIVYIGENLPACMNDPCPVYTPETQARYVLEVNSSYTISHHWKVGDKLDLKGV